MNAFLRADATAHSSTKGTTVSLKDLSAYLTPDLEIPWGGRTFISHPPTKDAGLKLAAINAVGVQAYQASLDQCPTCGRAGAPEIPAETLAVVESIGDTDVASLALGQDCFDAMVTAGVPGPHIDTMGMYALYYWTLGEATADQIMAAAAGDGAGKASRGSASSTLPHGPRSASASRTRKASTRATGASRTA